MQPDQRCVLLPQKYTKVPQDGNKNESFGSRREMPENQLESQGVLCDSYRLVVLFTVNCTEMAHKKCNVPQHS